MSKMKQLENRLSQERCWRGKCFLIITIYLKKTSFSRRVCMGNHMLKGVLSLILAILGIWLYVALGINRLGLTLNNLAYHT